MDVFLVRHGRTQGNVDSIFMGDMPFSLLEEERAKAEAVGRYLRSRPIGRILSSPVVRALETARPTARDLGLTIEPTAAFTEIGFGKWHGLSRSEVAKTSPVELSLWDRAPHLLSFEGFETIDAIERRAISCLASLAIAGNEKGVAVFSHEAIIRVVLAWAVGGGAVAYSRLHADPCSVSHINMTEGQIALVSANETSFLTDI